MDDEKDLSHPHMTVIRKFIRYLIVSFLFSIVCLPINAQQVLNSLDSLLAYVRARSIRLQSGEINLAQAKQAKLAALLGLPDISGGLSWSYTKNTKLPVNLLPGETFGGQPGTYKEVAFGVPYVNYANENLDIKLFNPKAWENIRLYKLNVSSTELQNKLTLKSLFEDVSSTYYNIVSLKEQLFSTKQNTEAAFNLLQVAQNKYDNGLTKQQDVNDARASYLTTQENARQIQFLIDQQYLALKILCDIPDLEPVEIIESIPSAEGFTPATPINQALELKSMLVKETIAQSTYRQQVLSLYPTLSFFQAYTTQQYNTKAKLFDPRVKWIPSSYLGIRLSFPIPSSNSVAQVSKARYDYLLSKKNMEQQMIKSDLELKKLIVEYNKAMSQAKSNSAVFILRTDTYEKNLNLYEEGLINLEQTINSFNAMVNSNYNLISSRVSVLAAIAKININNNIE
jgi:outer membrane protein TolC